MFKLLTGHVIASVGWGKGGVGDDRVGKVGADLGSPLNKFVY